MAIAHDIIELKEKVENIRDFLANGDDLSLPIRQVSILAEELRDQMDKQSKIIESLLNSVGNLTTTINRIDQDAIRA